MSSAPLETLSRQLAQAWEDVLSMLGGAALVALYATCRRCLSPTEPHATGGLLLTPSPFPFLTDLMNSFSFVRDEKQGESVHEWVKP